MRILCRRRAEAQKSAKEQKNCYTVTAGGFRHENPHFLREGYKSCVFYPNDVTGDLEYEKICFLILEKLFKNYKVCTVLSAVDLLGEAAVRKEWWKQCFPYRQYQFLCAYGLTEPFCFTEQQELITVTDGVNLPLMQLLLNPETYDSQECTICMYAYTQFPFCIGNNIQNIAMPEFSQADLQVYYYEEPDYLSIIFNSSTVVIENIITALQEICFLYGKKLMVCNL